jgi:hypothetical protein
MPDETLVMKLLGYERNRDTLEAGLWRDADGKLFARITAVRKDGLGGACIIRLQSDETRYLIRALQAAAFEMDAAEGKLPPPPRADDRRGDDRNH